MDLKLAGKTALITGGSKGIKPLPFGRGGTAEEIGAAIDFIASDHSGYTSGSVVTIDAGLSARAQAF